MEDEVFCHGHTGQWVFVVSHLREIDGSASGTSEIRYCGTVRGRLSLSHQMTGAASLVLLLRAKSVEWVERAEKDAADFIQIEMRARERTDEVGRRFSMRIPLREGR